MAKVQRRKPPKRSPGKPKLDDDLIELAEVLAEREYIDGVQSWFELPWRSGWNAAHLCCMAAQTISTTGPYVVRLASQITAKGPSSNGYEEAETNRVEATLAGHGSAGFWVDHYQLLGAGFRCVQLTLANSSGGGNVFNDVLRLVFSKLEQTRAVNLRGEVREARCYDAIGVGPDLNNDKNDRLRRAFKIAWDRGLYHMAYALPQAT